LRRCVLISGVRGQDGSYLAELLLENGYQVIGLTRDPGLLFEGNISHLKDKIELCYTAYDFHSLSQIISKYRPEKIFNLCGQPYVLKSWSMIDETIKGSGMIPCHFLQAISEIDREIKFFQASSSEIFEPDKGEGLTENSRILPRTPYGCAKALAHNMVVSFRENYNLFAVNGILFNHESSRRRENFLSRKVVREAVRIKKGLSEKLELGNLSTMRDWGHAKEYMDAVNLMLESDVPEDYIISTGKTHSVEDMVRIIFEKLDLDYREYIFVNEEFVRPFEPQTCRGIPNKIYKELGWSAKTPFKDMLEEMILEELQQYEVLKNE